MPPNVKQTTLTFSVGKRTTSSSQLNGKGSKSAPKPTELSKPEILSFDSKATEQEESAQEDPIIVSSDTDDDSEGFDDVSENSDDRVTEPTKRKATRSTGSKTRASSAEKVAHTKRTAMAQDARADIDNPGVFRPSNSSLVDATTAKTKTPVKVAMQSNDSKEDLPTLNLKDSKLSKYYVRVKKQTGNMSLIHGEDQNKVHEILRVFDTSYEYGPCVGVSRLERWNRAKALGLNPPKEVGDILKTKEGTTENQYSQSVFHGLV